MPQPIKVDNSQPATAYDTARTLGVSKKRTDKIIRAVRRILFRDAKTGEFVIRAKQAGKKKAVKNSHNGSTKVRKSASARRKA